MGKKKEKKKGFSSTLPRAGADKSATAAECLALHLFPSFDPSPGVASRPVEKRGNDLSGRPFRKASENLGRRCQPAVFSPRPWVPLGWVSFLLSRPQAPPRSD